MTTVPTPADFLMSREPDEEYDAFTAPAPVEADPLSSIAYSLRKLVELTRGKSAEPSWAAITASTGWEPEEDRAQTLAEELADEQAKHAVVIALVDQIEGIVRKSTSQVSLAVKSAIEAWKNPQTPSPAPDVAESAVDDAAGAGYPEQDVQQSAGEGLPQPAVDAPVDEWRVYARALRGVTNGDSSIDSMNRSQIRTLLGIRQPVTQVAGA